MSFFSGYMGQLHPLLGCLFILSPEQELPPLHPLLVPPEQELPPHPFLAPLSWGFDPLQALFPAQPLTERVVPDIRPAMHRPASIFFKLSVFTTSSLFDFKKENPSGARIHEKMKYKRNVNKEKER